MAVPSMIQPEIWSYNFGTMHPIDHSYSASSGSITPTKSVDSDIEPLSLPPPMMPVPSSGLPPPPPQKDAAKQPGKKRKHWGILKRLLASAKGRWHHAHGKRASRCSSSSSSAAQSFQDRRRWDQESEAWCMYMPTVMHFGSDEDVNQACQEFVDLLRERA